MNFLKIKNLAIAKKNFIVLGLILVFIFFPRPSSAISLWNIFDSVAGLGSTIPYGIVTIIFGVLAYTCALSAWLMGYFLDLLIVSDFLIGYNYTNNEIIRLGLDITKSFVNMGLVVILVFIALSIALRLKEYASQKTLISLIAVALLVNFAPVVCGLIVDASNIVMNYFLKALTKGVSPSSVFLDISFYNRIQDVLTITIGPLSEKLSLLARTMIACALYSAISWAFLLFAGLFLLRYVAIWLLVILSPLAFVALILPGTRKFWQQWWNQFIQWSIIGIPMAFFLYLATVSFKSVKASLLANRTITAVLPFSSDSSITDFYADVIPYYIPLAILYIGFILGLQTSAMGAGSIISGIKKAGKWTAGKTWKGMALGDRKIFPSVHEQKEGENKKWYQRITPTSPRKGARWAIEKWEKVPVVRWFRPEPLRRFSEARGALESLEKEVTGPSETEIQRVANGSVTGMRAATRVWSIVKNRGDAQDLFTAYMKKYEINPEDKDAEEKLFKNEKFLEDKTLLNAIDLIKDAGEKGKVLRVSPRLTRLFGKTKEERKKILKEYLETAKPSDISKWEREEIEDPEVMEALLAIGDEGTYRTIGGLKGKVAARRNTINKAFSKWVKENNRQSIDKKGNTEAYLAHLAEEYGVTKTGYERALERKQAFLGQGWDEFFEYNEPGKEGTTPSPAAPSTVRTTGPTKAPPGYTISAGGIFYPEEFKRREEEKTEKEQPKDKNKEAKPKSRHTGPTS